MSHNDRTVLDIALEYSRAIRKIFEFEESKKDGLSKRDLLKIRSDLYSNETALMSQLADRWSRITEKKKNEVRRDLGADAFVCDWIEEQSI